MHRMAEAIRLMALYAAASEWWSPEIDDVLRATRAPDPGHPEGVTLLQDLPEDERRLLVALERQLRPTNGT